jgi:hypothetical protein
MKLRPPLWEVSSYLSKSSGPPYSLVPVTISKHELALVEIEQTLFFFALPQSLDICFELVTVNRDSTAPSVEQLYLFALVK